jgi:HlyD family secretion protein
MRYLLFIPLLLFINCKEKTEVIKPTRKSITESIYASGNIESKNQYTAYATASGIVGQIYASDGESIFSGSPILSVKSVAQQLNKDNAQLVAAFQDINSNQSKLREASQMIELARTKMVNDSIQYDRQKKLDAKGIGTKIELEATQLSYQNSKINYSSSKSNYRDLKRQLELNSQQAKNNLRIVESSQNDYTLKSLINGKIYSLNVGVGEIVSPQTPIAIIGESNVFVLKMRVDEYDINRLKIGQKTMVVLNSERDKTYEAVITRIYPLMNAQSKTFLVEAEFVTRPNILYPNVTFEANIVVQTNKNALLIPREYLIDNAYVMDENEKKIKVKTGIMDFQMVEILAGISERTVLMKPAK